VPAAALRRGNGHKSTGAIKCRKVLAASAAVRALQHKKQVKGEKSLDTEKQCDEVDADIESCLTRLLREQRTLIGQDVSLMLRAFQNRLQECHIAGSIHPRIHKACKTVQPISQEEAKEQICNPTTTDDGKKGQSNENVDLVVLTPPVQTAFKQIKKQRSVQFRDELCLTRLLKEHRTHIGHDVALMLRSLQNQLQKFQIAESSSPRIHTPRKPLQPTSRDPATSDDGKKEPGAKKAIVQSAPARTTFTQIHSERPDRFRDKGTLDSKPHMEERETTKEGRLLAKEGTFATEGTLATKELASCGEHHLVIPESTAVLSDAISNGSVQKETITRQSSAKGALQIASSTTTVNKPPEGINLFVDKLVLKVRRKNVLRSWAAVQLLKRGIMLEFTIVVMLVLLVLLICDPWAEQVSAPWTTERGETVILTRTRSHVATNMTSCTFGVVLLLCFMHQANWDVFLAALWAPELFILGGSFCLSEFLEFIEIENVYGHANVGAFGSEWKAWFFLTLLFQRLPVILCLVTVDSFRMKDAFEGDERLNKVVRRLSSGRLRDLISIVAKRPVGKVFFILCMSVHLAWSIQSTTFTDGIWSDQQLCVLPKRCLPRRNMVLTAKQTILIFTGKLVCRYIMGQRFALIHPFYTTSSVQISADINEIAQKTLIDEVRRVNKAEARELRRQYVATPRVSVTAPQWSSEDPHRKDSADPFGFMSDLNNLMALKKSTLQKDAMVQTEPMEHMTEHASTL
jgi:hypothetical protein